MLSLPPDWLNWTVPTLIFLGSIITLLTIMTFWDIYDPGWASDEGLLPIATTRGDRFFMGLLITGVIFCLWLFLFGQTAVWGVLILGALSIISTINFF